MLNSKTILKGIIFVPLSAIIVTLIGWFLFSLSYLIPTKTIVSNMNESIGMLTEEKIYNDWLIDDASAKNDGWSESVLLAMAMTPPKNGNIFKAPLILKYISVKDESSTFKSLYKYAENPNIEIEYSSNNRYWNGLVMFLKAGLSFLSLAQFHIFIMYIEIGLLALIIFKMSQKGLKNETIIFMIMMLAMNTITIGMSLKYIPEYVVMLCGCLFILDRKITFLQNPVNFSITFSIIGALTSFFNMLSFPLISLGIPMFIYVWRVFKEDELKISNIILGIISWFVGYFICWGLKWTFCSLFTEENLLANAFQRANQYHTVDESLLATMLRNLNVYNRSVFKIVFAVTIIYFVFVTIKNRNKIDFSKKIILQKIITYGVLFVLPVLFFKAFGPGYAYTHHSAAFRNLTIMFGSVLGFLLPVWKKKEN